MSIFADVNLGKSVDNARMKGISSDCRMCHNGFIPLNTLVGASTFSEYSCQREILDVNLVTSGAYCGKDWALAVS